MPNTATVSTRRRVVLDDDDNAPFELRGHIVLDETTPLRRRRTPTPKVVNPRRSRDNRLARAFRAIIENPAATIAEQASIADVTLPMLNYYHIQLRSIYRIIYEKHGDGVIPALPALRAA